MKNAKRKETKTRDIIYQDLTCEAVIAPVLKLGGLPPPTKNMDYGNKKKI